MRPKVTPPTAAEKKQAAEAPPQVWTVGEKVLHGTFGVGEITHVFGSDRKVSVAVKFPSIGQKVLEPRSTGLRKISKV